MNIGIIGAGNVGTGIADALAYLGIGKKIIIYNRHIDKATGEIWDLDDMTVHRSSRPPTLMTI